MTNLDTKIPCPNCGSKKNRQIKGNQLQCNKCNAVHDGKANEHGRALHHDPVRNATIFEAKEGNNLDNSP